MRIWVYIIIVLISLCIPVEKADVAKLQPVEAAALCVSNGKIEIYTDTGARGIGDNAQEALEDLINNTAGIVYLDTAKYLLLERETVGQVDYLREELKSGVKLCLWDENENIRSSVKYLSVHNDLPKLKDWNEGESLPEYICKKQ